MMEGGPAPNMVSASTGIQRFAQYSRFQAPYGNMTNIVSKSNVGETYAALLHNSLQNSEALGGILAATTVSTVFPNDNFGQQMSQVAKLIKMRQPLNLERSVFITTLGGWDTHGTFNLDPLYGAVDRGVGALAMELKAQGVWEDVVVLTVSDFGRTLKSNGAGTDHAWGGQHWIAGGSVKGGQIFGQYPKSLLTSDETNISQGRATIPTTPWEGPWRGIVEWFGVLPQDISTVWMGLAFFLWLRADLVQRRCCPMPPTSLHPHSSIATSCSSEAKWQKTKCTQRDANMTAAMYPSGASITGGKSPLDREKLMSDVP